MRIEKTYKFDAVMTVEGLTGALNELPTSIPKDAEIELGDTYDLWGGGESMARVSVRWEVDE